MNVVRSVWRRHETSWCSSTFPVVGVSLSAQTPLATLSPEACCDSFSGSAAVTAAATAATVATVDVEARTDQGRCSRSPCLGLRRDVGVAVAATPSPLLRVIVLTAAASAVPMAVGLRTTDYASDFGYDDRGAASHDYYSHHHRQFRGGGISQNLSLFQQQSLVGDDEISDYYTEYTGDVHVVAEHAHQRMSTEKHPALLGQPPTEITVNSLHQRKKKRFDPSLGEIAVESSSDHPFHDSEEFTTTVPSRPGMNRAFAGMNAYLMTDITTTMAATGAVWGQVDPSLMMQPMKPAARASGSSPTPKQIWEATRQMQKYALSAEAAKKQMEMAIANLVAPGAAGGAPSTLQALMPALMGSVQAPTQAPTPAQSPTPTQAPTPAQTPTPTQAPTPAQQAPEQQAPAQQAPAQGLPTSLPCDCRGDVPIPVGCNGSDREALLRAEIHNRASDLVTLQAALTREAADKAARAHAAAIAAGTAAQRVQVTVQNAQNVAQLAGNAAELASRRAFDTEKRMSCGGERRRRWLKEKDKEKKKEEKKKKEKEKKEAKKKKKLRKQRAKRAKAAARKAKAQAIAQAATQPAVKAPNSPPTGAATKAATKPATTAAKEEKAEPKEAGKKENESKEPKKPSKPSPSKAKAKGAPKKAAKKGKPKKTTKGGKSKK